MRYALAAAKTALRVPFGDPVIGDVKEAYGAAGLAQLLRYLALAGGFPRVQTRNIYNGNLIHDTLPGNMTLNQRVNRRLGARLAQLPLRKTGRRAR